MLTSFHAAGAVSGFDLTPQLATVIAASTAATVSLVVAVVTVIVSRLNERDRQRHELARATVDAATRFRNERLDALRTASADYCGMAVQEVEYSVSLMKNPDQDDTRHLLLASHSQLRIQYERLLLLSDWRPAQVAAREVLRVTWNERQEGLGLPRKRPRIPEDMAPAKWLRLTLRDFTREIRAELGLSADLVDEPDD